MTGDLFPTLRRLRGGNDDGLVGLEVEADSIAAAEVHENGTAQLVTSAIAPLAPGAVDDGEVANADAVAEVLRSLFSEHKLSRRVRLGVANQRVVVRTLRLPAIEDPKELAAAVRFTAQEQIPMPIEEAVLDHRVVGGAPASEGMPPQLDVVVVAARSGMIDAWLDVMRAADLQPVGIDLSAFGLIRALGDLPETNGDDAGQAHYRHPLLQHRRRHQPRGRSRSRLPVHPRLAGRPRGRRGFADRRHWAQPRTRPAVARRTSGWHSLRSRSKATRRRSPGYERRWRAVPRRYSTSCASRSTSTALRRVRSRSSGSCSAAPAALSPASPSRWNQRSGCRSRVAVPPPSPGSTRLPRPASPSPTDWRWRSSSCDQST